MGGQERLVGSHGHPPSGRGERWDGPADPVDGGANVRVAVPVPTAGKDHEKSVLSSETIVRLAMVHLMLNRLEPKEEAAEFHEHTEA